MANQLELITAEISQDEGGTKWEATCVLANVQDITQFQVNKAFTLLFFGESYSLIVDSLAVDRSEVQPGSYQPQVTVYGVSPIAKYQTPRALPVSKTWTTDTNASAIAQEMIPGISWEIIDWVVPANVLGVEKVAPADVVTQLATAAGGILESLPDGTIHVRYKFPVSVPAYGPTTKDVTLVDEIDNFSYQEKYTPNRLVNLLKITDEQDKNQSDRAEFEADPSDPDAGTLHVYPAVWRETISMHATAPVVSQTYLGVVSRQVTEQVEFVAGKASTQYPVVSINSYTWNTTDLGLPTAQFYTTQLVSAVPDYSLLNITYTTQAHDFRVIGFDQTTVQMVVEDA